jgi:hypothetical protein
MEFSNPYNLGRHITDDFYTNLQSSKWSERKDAMQGLIDVMEKNPVLEQNDHVYQKLSDDLSKILSKDANINVAATAAQTLGKLASGSPEMFKRNAPNVALLCFTRMKDVKPVIKNACIDCLDSVYSTTTFANVIEPIKQGLSITAPGSKVQTCEFFTRIMLKMDFPTAKNASAGTKEIVNQLCKLALMNDVACREAAMRALAAFMRAVTKNIALPLLVPIAADKLKMEKIEENYEQFIVEYPFDDGTKKVEANAPCSSSNGMEEAANGSNEPEVIDSRLFATPYNLTKHINDDFYTNLQSSKWSERKDAMQGLIDVMEKNPVLEPNDQVYQKLVDDLSKILGKDANINVAATAAQTLGKLAYGEPKIFAHSAPNVALLCFTRMKDVKPVIKNACIDCLDLLYSTTTFANVIEPIKQGLSITAPGSKIQTCEFFTRIMLKIDFATAKSASAGTKEIVNLLCKLALMNDVACREAAMRSLAAFMRAVTKNVALPLLVPIAADKLKMEKIEENYEKFIAEYPFKGGVTSAPVQPQPKPSSASTTVRGKSSVASAPVQPKAKSSSASTTSRGKSSVASAPVQPQPKSSSASTILRRKPSVASAPVQPYPKSPGPSITLRRKPSVTSVPVQPKPSSASTTSRGKPPVASAPVQPKSSIAPTALLETPSSAGKVPNQRRSMIRPPTVVIRPNQSSRQVL